MLQAMVAQLIKANDSKEMEAANSQTTIVACGRIM